jgi:hypothetical protein
VRERVGRAQAAFPHGPLPIQPKTIGAVFFWKTFKFEKRLNSKIVQIQKNQTIQKNVRTQKMLDSKNILILKYFKFQKFEFGKIKI